MGRGAVEVGSGNVYADLGFEDPGLEQAKAALAREIRAQIQMRGLTTDEASRHLGISGEDVARIVRGRLGRFSLERLHALYLHVDTPS